MITKVQRWGRSQGIRLSNELLSQVAIEIGDAVEVTVRHGSLLVTPVRQGHGGHELRELVRRIPKDHEPGEPDWGPPVGREVW